jgi:hypothetical protein
LSGVPLPPGGGVDADGGMMGQLATHSTGHLGFE